MRIFYLAILIFVGSRFTLPAQTNASTNAVEAILALVTTNAPPPPTNSTASNPIDAFKTVRGPICIDSDGPADFDLNAHWVTYQDNVRVSDPQMKMTCEWLEANLPLQSSEHLTNIVARTNVVVDFTDDKGQKTHATGDKAVYFLHVQNGVTNETVTLTGNPPEIQQGPDSMLGDAIIWNRITGHVIVKNPRGVFWQSTNSPVESNSPAMGTNELAMPTNAPAPGTNQMPAPKSP